MNTPMNPIIENIIIWLKAHGKRDTAASAYFTCHDEPFMNFSAEWQDSGNTQRLLLGYWSVENGDVCYDPQFAWRIKDGELTCCFQNDLVGVRLQLKDAEELKQALDFASLVFRRHMNYGPDVAPSSRISLPSQLMDRQAGGVSAQAE